MKTVDIKAGDHSHLKVVMAVRYDEGQVLNRSAADGLRTGCECVVTHVASVALQKVAQRPWGFRSLQRADSVGSETSRSKSSIGAASGRRHTDAASPPEQLQSAANILAGLSSQRPS